MKDDGGPAFPVPEVYNQEACIPSSSRLPGMTLRDYFAGQAMQGILSCQDFMNDICVRLRAEGRGDRETARAVVAELAYKQADAMLSERAK